MRAWASTIAFAATMACSSSQPPSSQPLIGATLAKPPPRPNATSVAGTTRWLAMKHVDLGLMWPQDVYSSEAWTHFGFDLDDRVTTADDSKWNRHTCQRVTDAPPGILVDGIDGRDNGFGAWCMQTMKSLQTDVEVAANDGIASGDFTILVRIDDVGPDDDATVPGAFYVARHFGSAPTWSEADHWPVVSTSLVDGADLRQPNVVFPTGYMNGGVWVSGPLQRASAQIDFELFGSKFGLRIDALQIVIDLSTGTGTLAGFTKRDTLAASLASGVPSFGLCPGDPRFDAVVSNLTQAADLVADAPGFQDDSATCDAISIGLGLEMSPTGAPTVVVPPDDPPPCK